ncbi:MAG: Uma2 family endonuclease [Selenomonas sp.]|nr:Uma2 family endonuclease [Selenomonas sp.]
MQALVDYQKSERINGTVYDMSPANTNHIRIQRNLSGIIWSFLRGKRCDVFTEIGVDFDEDNYFIPDLVVVCDPNKITHRGINGAPDFVVEVLSTSTRKRDIDIKKQTYERFGVKEYWIINPKDESIEVYILKNGKYELDNVYHNLSEEDWDELDEDEKAQQQLSLKISLYSDLEIPVKDIFEI